MKEEEEISTVFEEVLQPSTVEPVTPASSSSSFSVFARVCVCVGVCDSATTLRLYGSARDRGNRMCDVTQVNSQRDVTASSWKEKKTCT